MALSRLVTVRWASKRSSTWIIEHSPGSPIRCPPQQQTRAGINEGKQGEPLEYSIDERPPAWAADAAVPRASRSESRQLRVEPGGLGPDSRVAIRMMVMILFRAIYHGHQKTIVSIGSPPASAAPDEPRHPEARNPRTHPEICRTHHSPAGIQGSQRPACDERRRSDSWGLLRALPVEDRDGHRVHSDGTRRAAWTVADRPRGLVRPRLGASRRPSVSFAGSPRQSGGLRLPRRPV